MRGDYQDVIERERKKVEVMLMKIDKDLVDVKVKKEKEDVRFRDKGIVRGMIVGEIKKEMEK